jgi:uncharacterized membrane protein YoaK (UPF0700 family)
VTEVKKTEQPPVYLEFVLGLTAFAAGAVDVISFVRLGGIFASAMTGNLAFLGIYLARFSFYSAIGSGIGLCGFIVGSAVGNVLTRGRGRPESLNILLGIEIFLLIAVVILWFPVAHKNGSASADVLIALLAVSMGLQSIVGKKINLSNIPTVVFTSTLTNLVIGITDALAAEKFVLPKDTRRQAASFFLYFFGALVAGGAAYLQAAVLVFLPVCAIGLALAIKILQRKE